MMDPTPRCVSRVACKGGKKANSFIDIRRVPSIAASIREFSHETLLCALRYEHLLVQFLLLRKLTFPFYGCWETLTNDDFNPAAMFYKDNLKETNCIFQIRINVMIMLRIPSIWSYIRMANTGIGSLDTSRAAENKLDLILHSIIHHCS